ncbi:FAD:protein FMN transferase [Siphonobacter sp. SORGH_AS_1065]|uniref:FAD:protein FMN transferase n=1 Tax=Siphonobacter sp. SORGH_AS_1065 TaxID=3041795 RepID=UPI00277FFD08|nr:FAD:protein FMN transferase [Siphonobacter sp. SORGH_AS_1065]MDQ1087996.1 thiamine biosynthesis lipoprotein [Siphonobacter sp. SORGH_AS_1065]
MKKILCLGVILLCLNNVTWAQRRKLIFQQPKMGSMFTIQVWSSDSLKAATAASQAFLMVDSLNQVFSDYNPDSELSKLNRTAGSSTEVKVSPALWDILSISKEAWEKSSGWFDVTVGQLTLLWRQSRKEEKLPPVETLKKAIQTVGAESLLLNKAKQTVQLKRPGTKLDLGGIGKGYAAQRMLEMMKKAGFEESLCDAAGNMAIGKNPSGGWKIGVEWPGQRDQLLENWLVLNETAISTSGDVYQSVTINGKTYSHIVSPKNGLGVTYQRQVTILSKDAAHADWLSTACYLLPAEKAMQLAKSERAEILIIDKQKSGFKTIASEGFKKLLKEE